LSVQDSNNKHIEDEYLDQREQVGKNEGQIYFISLPTPKSEKNIFILPTDRPLFLSRSACRTTD